MASWRWRRALVAVVCVGDVLAAGVGTVVAVHLCSGTQAGILRIVGNEVDYVLVGVAAAVAWHLVLGCHGAHEPAAVGARSDELRPVLQAGVTLFAVVAVSHLVLSIDVSARLVVLLVAVTVLLSLAVRVTVEQVAHYARMRRRWVRRTVLYGPERETQLLASQLGNEPAAGVEVVGACLVDAADSPPLRTGLTRTSVGDDVLQVVTATGADLLAVTGGTSPRRLRSLAWALEGSGVDLLVAPAVEISHQRVSIRPVGGLPLLRVEGSRLTGGWLLVKELVDRLGAGLLLLVLVPVMLVVAMAVWSTSPGPVLYRQRRVGRDGRTFDLLKFRTMVIDAESQLPRMVELNSGDGLLFKIRDDPRVTSVGRLLRRWSIDELPQLWNVLRGDMSLVGPRPLPVQPDDFRGDERRRLRVKPGITGLWQISGRSELAWDETVRLDVHYIDQWSLALDLSILLRTPAAVLRGRGAY